MSLSTKKEYWLKRIQIELYNELLDYIEATGLTQKQIAEKLGVSPGYVSQLMNGEADHKISKIVDLAFLMDKVPIINYHKYVNYAKKEEAGIMLPFKSFDYYVNKDPNKLKDESFHVEPSLKINMRWFSDSFNESMSTNSPDKSVEAKVKNFKYEPSF